MKSKYFARLISALLAIIISLISLAACGGVGNGSGNTGNNTDNNSDNNNGGSSDNNNSDNSNGTTLKKGNTVGDLCHGLDLERVGGGDTVNVEDFRGKVVVINFWGTWCGPCKAELPHFDEVAAEYADEVVILSIHSVLDKENAEEYVNENFPDSNIIFLYDSALTSSKDKYYTLLGADGYYPYNIVLDKDGVITFSNSGALSKEELISKIENALK